MAAVSPQDFHVSERIQHLAEPKKIKDVWNYSRPFNVCSCGWKTKIWGHPLSTYDGMPSERILRLSEPKQYSSVYLEQRPRSSPLWPVSSPALSCKPSQRILDLSQPRPLNPSFILPKEPETTLTQAARISTASPRILLLAQPVIKKSMPCYENRYKEAPIRKVSPAALQAAPSPRIAELSRPKALPAESSPDRAAEWPVSQAALKATASPRIGQLAQRPIRASTNFLQFNPDAFTVKETAKNAYCTDRIKKLAEPVVR